MNLINEAKEFARLSCVYRRASDEERQSVLKEIHALIDMNVQRLALNFKVDLDLRKSGFDRRRGAPIFTMSLPRMIAKKGYVQMRDITTYNVRREQKITGCNILLDFSGSMWWNGANDAIKGVLRIHLQNFFVVCLLEYLKRVSKESLRVLVTAVASTPIQILKMDDVQKFDLDGFLVSSEMMSKSYQPNFYAMIHTDVYHWGNYEYPREALEQSYAYFDKHAYKNFLTLFVTDGGMHRIGESPQDRAQFLSKIISSISTEDNVVFFMLMKEDGGKGGEGVTIPLLKRLNVPFSVCNNVEQYNQCFDYLVNFINKMVGA